jgi:hypothetical protein
LIANPFHALTMLTIVWSLSLELKEKSSRS